MGHGTVGEKREALRSLANRALAQGRREARGICRLARAPGPDPQPLAPGLRRFRLPIPARVLIDHGRPVSVRTDRPMPLAGGRVQAAAGPWRTSGEWWKTVATAGTATGVATGAATRTGARHPPNRGAPAGTATSGTWRSPTAACTASSKMAEQDGGSWGRWARSLKRSPQSASSQ